MEKIDLGKATKLLYKILDIIAYKDKSDNDTFLKLYPLISNPTTQPIPKLFKSHLFVLFLELGILFQYAGTRLRCKFFDQWKKILSSIPYTAIITRTRIQSVRSTKVELSVNYLFVVNNFFACQNNQSKRNLQASQKKLCRVDNLWNLQWQDYYLCAMAFWYKKGIFRPGVYTWIWIHESWRPSWLSTTWIGLKCDHIRKINIINERTGIWKMMRQIVDAIQP